MGDSEQKTKLRFVDWVLAGVFIVGFTAVVLAMIIPSGIRPTPATKSPQNECINNLRLIYEAKQEWALETHHGTNDIPTVADLSPYLQPYSNYFKGQFPQCPSGGKYTIGKVGEPPTCSLGTNVIPAHVLP